MDRIGGRKEELISRAEDFADEVNDILFLNLKFLYSGFFCFYSFFGDPRQFCPQLPVPVLCPPFWRMDGECGYSGANSGTTWTPNGALAGLLPPFLWFWTCLVSWLALALYWLDSLWRLLVAFCLVSSVCRYVFGGFCVQNLQQFCYPLDCCILDLMGP